jgi:REP element-mobilizing transposase RayT
MSIWHITIGVTDRHPCFGDEARLLVAVRALVRTAGTWTLMFCIVDEHVHLAVKCDRERAGRIAQATALAVRPYVGGNGLEPARIRPVSGNRHLDNLVGYLVRQPAKHGVNGHPALWGGSCFLDLVGARVIDGFDPKRIAAAYPRYRVARLHDAVGLAGASPAPASLDTVHRIGLARLVEATAAAHAVPDLSGRARPANTVRATAARLGLEAGFRCLEVSDALGVHRSQIGRLARRAREDLATAARVRLSLEEAIRAATSKRHVSLPHGTTASRSRW